MAILRKACHRNLKADLAILRNAARLDVERAGVSGRTFAIVTESANYTFRNPYRRRLHPRCTGFEESPDHKTAKPKYLCKFIELHLHFYWWLKLCTKSKYMCVYVYMMYCMYVCVYKTYTCDRTVYYCRGVVLYIHTSVHILAPMPCTIHH